MTSEPQVLESAEADFEKMTWTFTLNGNSEVSAGNFAILPSEVFATMTRKLAHAEGLLKRVLGIEYSVGIGGNLHEAIESFFDPLPPA